jgi:hypothetical protein
VSRKVAAVFSGGLSEAGPATAKARVRQDTVKPLADLLVRHPARVERAASAAVRVIRGHLVRLVTKRRPERDSPGVSRERGMAAARLDITRRAENRGRHARVGPGPGDGQPRTTDRKVAGLILKVVRSGGIAGQIARGELDTAAEPDGNRLEEAVRQMNPATMGSGRPQPDRYVYRLEVRDSQEAEPIELTMAEQDLDPDVAWLLDRVLKPE